MARKSRKNIPEVVSSATVQTEVQITLKLNASSATAELLFHF